MVGNFLSKPMNDCIAARKMTKREYTHANIDIYTCTIYSSAFISTIHIISICDTKKYELKKDEHIGMCCH